MSNEVFETEILPHKTALTGFAMKLTRDKDLAEDLLQDTLLRAYRNIDKYTPGTDAKSWVFLMMKRLWINHFRATRKLRENLERFSALEKAEPRFHQDDFTENLDPQILRAIEDLPEEWARTVVLSDLCDLEHLDIAQILDCPVGTVMSRMFRARRYLRKILGKYAWETYGIKPQHRSTKGKKMPRRKKKAKEAATV